MEAAALLMCVAAFSQGTVEDYRRASAIRGKYADKDSRGTK